MAMSKGTQETEIKLAVKDARSARRLLREAGFVVSRPRVFEANTVFDTPDYFTAFLLIFYRRHRSGSPR